MKDKTSTYQRIVDSYKSDPPQKRQALLRKVARRDIIANLMLAAMLYTGKDIPQRKHKALTMYKKAAKKGSVSAMLFVGENYMNRSELPRKLVLHKSVFWFKSAARCGNAYAQKRLGDIYSELKDHRKAAKWYSDANANGDIKAGRLYLEEKKRLRSQELFADQAKPGKYRKAKRAFSAFLLLTLIALFLCYAIPSQVFPYVKNKRMEKALGYYYGTNSSVFDYDKALPLLKNLADEGVADAFYYIGNIYLSQKNYELAKENYTKAFDLGNDLSALMLLYWETDVEKVQSKAEILLNNGCQEASYVLAEINYMGIGKERNILKGIEYLEKTSDQWNPDWQAMSYARLCYIYSGAEWDTAFKSDEMSECAHKLENMGYYSQNCCHAFIIAAEAYAAAAQYKDAEKWYECAEQHGSTEATELWADYYCKHFQKDSTQYEMAAQLYEKAATEEQSGTAAKKLGEMYFYGNGVNLEYKKSVTWYLIAAEHGIPDSISDMFKLFVTEDLDRYLFDALTQMSEEGNITASVALGNCYEKGVGVEKNTDVALKIYNEASEKGSCVGRFCLAEAYENSLDYDSAMVLHEKNAKQEYYLSILHLADYYAYTDERASSLVKAQYWFEKISSLRRAPAIAYANIGAFYKHLENHELAYHWFLRGAQEKNAECMYQLGFMYDQGIWPNHDDELACYWYKKAADLGNANAMYGLGRMYLYGRGMKEANTEKHIEYTEYASEAGNGAATCLLGVYYEKGLMGFAEDKSRAMELYFLAAEQNDSTAMNNLGVKYLNGDIVEQDLAKGVEWIQKSALAGNANGMYNLGLLYLNGKGVDENVNMAYSWFQKSAEKDHSKAMWQIGRLYENGSVTDGAPDLEQAAYWYQKAIDAGYDASEDLARIS